MDSGICFFFFGKFLSLMLNLSRFDNFDIFSGIIYESIAISISLNDVKLNTFIGK